MSTSVWWRGVVVGGLICAAAFIGQWATWAGEEAAAPTEAPRIAAVFVEQPPVLDGNLDDPCWQAATRVVGFCDSDTGALAPDEFQGVAYLAQDAGHLYFGFHFADPQPNLIQAQQKKRGGDIGADDNIWVWMDTYGTGAYTYRFCANAAGAQNERIPRGAAPKIEWRGDWSCAAKIVGDGWNCEMAIPFSILQYGKGVKEFWVAFSRNISRMSKVYVWPNLGSNWDFTRAARWTGLNLPTFKPRPLIMPYVECEANKDVLQATQGADIKYRPQPGVTAMMTLNPDFKNIEQQVEGIDFTYTQRFVGDSRPFFLEGGEPLSNVWWTRQIPEVDLGAKVYGTFGQHNFDVTHVRDFGVRDDNVLNWYMDFNQGLSEASALMVNRHEPGVVDNTLVGAGLFAKKKIRGGEGTWGGGLTGYKTRTGGPGGDGSQWYAGMSCWPGQGRIGGSLDYQDTGAQYNPADGFFPDADKDVRKLSGEFGYWDRVDGRRVRSWDYGGSFSDQKRHDGTLYQRKREVYADASFQDNTDCWVAFNTNHRPPYSDRVWNVWGSWNTDELYRRGNAGVTTGHLGGGHYLYTSVGQGFYLGGGACAQLSVDTSRHKFPDRVETASLIIATFNQDLSAYKNVSARLVCRGGNHNVYTSYRQALRKGMDMYLILGDPNAEESTARVAVKALWVY